MKRIVLETPMYCEHCGIKLGEFVTYDYCETRYCSGCTYANTDIDEQQLRTDELDNLKMYKQWLWKELRETNKKMLELFGHEDF